MRVGLIINPIAGMGGSVGLKGTDGSDAVSQALALGAVPLAESKVVRTLAVLEPMQDAIEWIAPLGLMGGNALAAANQGRVKHLPLLEPSAAATKNAAREMLEEDVDLIVFAGGDGTARVISLILSDGGFRFLACLAVSRCTRLCLQLHPMQPADCSRT